MKKYHLLISFVLFLSGCATYDYSVKLRSSIGVKDVKVSWNAFEYDEWFLKDKKKESVNNNVYCPIPKMAKFEWQSEDGKKYEKELVIKLPKEFKKDRDGLIFQINEDNTAEVLYEIKYEQYKSREVKSE